MSSVGGQLPYFPTNPNTQPSSPQAFNWSGVPTPTNSPYPVNQPMRIDSGFPRNGNPFGGPMSFPPIGYPGQQQGGNPWASQIGYSNQSQPGTGLPGSPYSSEQLEKIAQYQKNFQKNFHMNQEPSPVGNGPITMGKM